MKILTLFLALALPVCADPELDDNLKACDWLLGTWKGSGKFMDAAFTEHSIYEVGPGGRSIFERAYAVDAEGKVVHEDRMIIWMGEEGLRCNFYESDPVRLTEFDLVADEKGIDFKPRGSTGVVMTFKREGKDGFTYVYAAKGPDGKEMKAVGENARSTEKYPERAAPAPAEAMKPLAAAAGKFVGEGKSDDNTHTEEMEAGFILAGEILEIRLTVKQANREKAETGYLWFWHDEASDGWKAHLISPDSPLMSLSGKREDATLTLTWLDDPDEELTMKWSWTADGYTWGMTNRGNAIMNAAGKRSAK